MRYGSLRQHRACQLARRDRVPTRCLQGRPLTIERRRVDEQVRVAHVAAGPGGRLDVVVHQNRHVERRRGRHRGQPPRVRIPALPGNRRGPEAAAGSGARAPGVIALRRDQQLRPWGADQPTGVRRPSRHRRYREDGCAGDHGAERRHEDSSPHLSVAPSLARLCAVPPLREPGVPLRSIFAARTAIQMSPPGDHSGWNWKLPMIGMASVTKVSHVARSGASTSTNVVRPSGRSRRNRRAAPPAARPQS
jgi:hypothetical protein